MRLVRRVSVALAICCGVAFCQEWTALGPRPLLRDGRAVSGRSTAVAVDPRNQEVVYLGTAGGGVWKSTNGGSNWMPLTDSQPSLVVGAIAVAPSQPDTIYVGTGEANFGYDNYYGAGVLKSTDGGATWTHLPAQFANLTGFNFGNANGDATGRIAALSVSPTDPNVVLAAVHLAPNRHGIYRTANGGVTWTSVLGGVVGTQVMFDPSDASGLRAFAALGKQGEGAWGLWRSVDAGKTWTRTSLATSVAFPINTKGRIALAAGANRSVLYVAIENALNGSLLAMYKSLDRGDSWTRITSVPDYCSPRCWEANALAVSSTNSNLLFAAGTSSVMKSADGGTTWADVASIEAGANHHAVALSRDASRLYSANDHGAWSMTVATGDWQNLNATLATSQFNGAFVSAKGGISGGVMGSGLVRFDAAWTADPCAKAGHVVGGIQQFASCDGLHVYESGDSGSSWVEVSGALGASGDRTLPVSPIASDSANGDVAYFGTYRLWRTTDRGATWSAVSPDLTPSTDGLVSAITVAPANPAVVYAGTSDGMILVSTNATAASPTWNDRSSGLPPRYVTSVSIHPVNPAFAIATISGFSTGTDTKGHVFLTQDGGSSWADISGDLPNSPVNHSLIDAATGEILVATDAGVFVSDNGGVNWTEAASGLPHSPAIWLSRNTTGDLLVSTHGRGMWKLAAAPPPGQVTLAPDAVDFGVVPTGSTSAAASLTLTNETPRIINISGITTTNAEFHPTSDCGSSLAPGAECSIDISFTPNVAGPLSGMLQVVTDDRDSPHTSELRGTGEVVVFTPRLVTSTASLEFTLPRGRSVSAEKRVMLSNTGNAQAEISHIWATAGFNVQSNCPSQLEPGGQCEIEVVAVSARSGNRRGQLIIESSAPTRLPRRCRAG